MLSFIIRGTENMLILNTTGGLLDSANYLDRHPYAEDECNCCINEIPVHL